MRSQLSSRSALRRLLATALLGSAILFAAAGCDEDSPSPVPAPAPPAPPPVEEPAPSIEASEVVDRETLEAFVKAAAEVAEAAIGSEAEAYDFFDRTFRPEGVWKHREIYLFVLETDGTAVFHAALPNLEGQDLAPLVDLRGVAFTQELLERAAAGGGFVEYLWDNPDLDGDEEGGSPKVGYAVQATIAGQDLVFGSGIYPPVTAVDVRNRGTLQAFVERAGAAVEEAAADPEAAYAFMDGAFRTDGEWRHGEIYVFVLTLEGVNFFQAPDPTREGSDQTRVTDLHGVNLGRIIVDAAEAGGGFVEYHFDNPAIEGDEETGSPKTSYVIPVTIGDTTLALGAGIYFTEGK